MFEPRYRRCFGVAFALAAALAHAAPALAAPAPARTRPEIRFYRFAAPSLDDASRSVRVYLPPSYALAESAGKRYPVVYLLHGWPGGDGNWPGSGRAGETLDSLIARGRIPEVIAVMPNGSGRGLLGRSLYLNSYDGRSRMEDYIVHDVVDWADSAFRTRPDRGHRALIGLSEGASAALNITFKHPERFGACGGHSGQYVLQHDIGMGAVWGPEPTATQIRTANSPTLYVEHIVPTMLEQVIYFDCGLGDGELEDNRALHRKLQSLSVPHTYNEFPGHHGWGYWKMHLRESLIACTSKMW